jgi:hypothetical protein
MEKNGMPHLMDELASGAAAWTMVRSDSRMGRSWAGCLAKKPSMGAPKSDREPGRLERDGFVSGRFVEDRFAAADLFLVGALEPGFAMARASAGRIWPRRI